MSKDVLFQSNTHFEYTFQVEEAILSEETALELQAAISHTTLQLEILKEVSERAAQEAEEKRIIHNILHHCQTGK
jgi:hypothetical protein